MKLAASSLPGDMDRYTAIDRLIQRAVLTRMVCQELLERPVAPFNRGRVDGALGFLMTWLNSFPETIHSSRASDGIDAMAVPDDCRQLWEEIRDGSKVCDGLLMLQSADSDSDYQSDVARIVQALAVYQEKHQLAVCPPPLFLAST